ncbi:HU family DNA-binding protein [Bacteroides stercorirosoris]|jgi:predicted histone-like DNA-binding protein|uniref:DNA-binding protein n=1 Tax=Bacteroides stercorirosoris TaxID=871324 RepID=A0A1M6K992_9BACE|nr:HU family DNA-binding protein [Bacteroides stercorirosoris]RGX76737.1 DNA-binding protein [Bacteroides stercorirosoris]SHJ55450.1 DNA-binding protein, histone-like, putative [Bacteroides stercorirosoris]
MAFYKKFQSKLNDLWYPKAITTGTPITTDKVADKLSLLSTVTRGDTYAVLKNLGSVMADYMAMGRTVKIEGVGTFYYTAAANKKGVATAAEVNSGQINGIRVRFIPEVKRSTSKQITTRSMVDVDVDWTDIEKLANGNTSGGNTDGGNQGGSGGGVDENPLG